MKLAVPLASKARYGVEIPPLKKRDIYYDDKSGELHCKLCKKDVRPTSEGRCNNCKLNCSLWHEKPIKFNS
jgi:hypothetical protein